MNNQSTRLIHALKAAKSNYEAFSRTHTLPSMIPLSKYNTSNTLILKQIARQDLPQQVMTKWNSPLDVFRIFIKGALNTLSNQANYHTLGRVLNSPLPDAKCKISIMRACKGM